MGGAQAESISRVLHFHGSLAAGDPQAERCIRIVAAMGGRLRHSFVAADGDFTALSALPQTIGVQPLRDFPKLGGLPLPGRLQKIARAMVDYHLVLTYGRHGVRAALAHTAFSQVHALPPLIHHEDGSDEPLSRRRSFGSRWLRRIGLGKAAGLVVPSETMEAIALEEWQQPMGRVKLIPDGVAHPRDKAAAKADGIGRLLKRPGELWIGCFARPDADEGILRLVESLRGLGDSWHLVIAGETQNRSAIEGAVARHALEHRVHLVPVVADRAVALGLFDIVAAPGGAEPLPVCIVEAAVAGRPVAGLAPIEAAALLSADNADLGEDALERLAGDAYLRGAIGAANRERALAERGEPAMLASYRRLYASAMGRDAL